MSILANVIGRGVLASRPAAGSPGRVYFITDGTPGLYRDNGSSWDSIGESGAAETLPASIGDAKGDLIGFTAADTPARVAVGANGHVLKADSAEAAGFRWAAETGGGTVNAQAHHWASAAPGSPAAQNDEFDDTAIDAKWTRVHNSGTPKGTWAEQEGALIWSMTAGATADMDVYTQARTISVGHYVEAGFVIPPWNGITTYVGAALGFADGAAHGAGAQVMGGIHLLDIRTYRNMLNSWSNYSTRGTDGTIFDGGAAGTPIYYRVKYEAANTWGLYVSVDGKNWRTVQSNFARTLTPTHIFVGTQMFNSPALESGKGVRIEYVRYFTS